MEKNTPLSIQILTRLAVIGNVLYILWMVYNGIDEGFHGLGTVQAVAISGLIVLLTLNIFLLFKKYSGTV